MWKLVLYSEMRIIQVYLYAYVLEGKPANIDSTAKNYGGCSRITKAILVMLFCLSASNILEKEDASSICGTVTTPT